jgi:hypothetical protein
MKSIDVYGVKVRFHNNYERSYSYKSHVSHTPGELILVPAGQWFEIVTVEACVKNPKFTLPEEKYKWVIGSVDSIIKDTKGH